MTSALDDASSDEDDDDDDEKISMDEKVTGDVEGKNVKKIGMSDYFHRATEFRVWLQR